LHKPISAAAAALLALAPGAAAHACGACRGWVLAAVFTDGFFATLALLVLPLALIGALAGSVLYGRTIVDVTCHYYKEAAWRPSRAARCSPRDC
jgi:hypothetical protein